MKIVLVQLALRVGALDAFYERRLKGGRHRTAAVPFLLLGQYE